MEKVIYSKCSLERREEFQIITTISTADNRKIVRKKAVNEKGINHIASIYNNYLRYNKVLKDTVISPVKCIKISDVEIEFEYIEGSSFSTIIEKNIENGNWESLKNDLLNLKKCSEIILGKKEFVVSDEFINIFGNIVFPDNKKIVGTEISNIDLITDNLIVIDDKVFILDYEWVLDFQVPVNYVLYRSILLNESISTLPNELIDSIYKLMGITDEEREIFYNMELCFQKYVMGNDYNLQQLYNEMPIRNYRISDSILNSQLNHCVVYGINKDNKDNIFEIYNEQKDFDIEIDNILPYQSIRIMLSDVPVIIKIVEIKGLKNKEYFEIDNINSNAEFMIHDDYYFSNPPFIELKNDEFDKIKLVYKILIKNENIVSDYVNVILASGEKDKVIANLEVEINEKNEKEASLINNVNQLQEVLDAINNRKLVKLIHKYDGIKSKFMTKGDSQ